MKPRHRDVLDPQRLKHAQARPALLALELDALGKRAVAVALDPEDVVAVRAPREQLEPARVRGRGRVGRVRALDGRVVDVERAQLLVVLQPRVDVAVREQLPCGGDVASVEGSGSFQVVSVSSR